MAKVPKGAETLPKISTRWVGCTNVADDRQTTEGCTTTYSEREHEFTFTKNQLSPHFGGNSQFLPNPCLKQLPTPMNLSSEPENKKLNSSCAMCDDFA